MADRTVKVRLEAAISGFQANLGKAKAATLDFAKTTNESLKDNRQAWENASRAAGVAGLAIGAGIAMAIKAYSDFDQAMSNVAATGEDARKNLDGLSEAAINAGKDIGFSATQSAEGIEALLKAGVSAKDVIGGGLTGALDLAAAGSLNVGDAAETAATAMTQFKLSGKDVPHIADLLAAGAGKAQGDVSDLALALKQGGLVAAQFGLSVEDTIGTLSAFASAGMIGSDAGTSLRNMLLRLANPSAKAAKLMKKLGIEAYDATGQFVGMAGLADELQDHLGGLTDAQRQSALATIFGSDAIRSASILYEQGSKGIDAWIKKTNDAGYAASVAATKQDNLAGDLRKLKANIEATFIKSGSSANQVLRDLVQGVTGLVTKVADLPAPLLKGGLAVAAIASGSLLAFSAVSKLATSMAALGVTGKDVRASLKAVRTSLKGVHKSALIAAAGFVAVEAAAQAMQSSVDKNSAGLEGYKNALIDLGKGGDDLDQSFQKLGDSWALWGQGINDTRSAFEAFNKMDNPFEKGLTWVGNILHINSSLKIMRDQLGQVDTALAGMSTQQAASAFKELSSEASAAGLSMDDQLQIFDDYKAKLVDVANQMGVTNLSAKEYYDWMGGKIPVAIQRAADKNPELAATFGIVGHSADDATKALDKTLDKLKDTASSAEDAQKNFEDLTDAMFDNSDAAIQLSGSQIGFEQAIDDATAAAKKNGKTLDVNTQKGRDNKRALDNLATSAHAYIEQQTKLDKSTKNATKTTEKARREFIKVAEKMGYTKGQAKKLADQYGLIPKDVKTSVSAPGATKAKKQAEALRKAIKNIPPKHRTEVMQAYKQDGYNAALARYRSIRDKTVSVTVHYGTSGYTTASLLGGPRMHLATGGPVIGPGTGTSDSVFARLSNGEHVFTAREVEAAGGHGKLIKFRQDLLAGMARFATGGPVQERTIVQGYQYQPKPQIVPQQTVQAPMQNNTFVGYDTPSKIVGALQFQEMSTALQYNLRGV